MCSCWQIERETKVEIRYGKRIRRSRLAKSNDQNWKTKIGSSKCGYPLVNLQISPPCRYMPGWSQTDMLTLPVLSAILQVRTSCPSFVLLGRPGCGWRAVMCVAVGKQSTMIDKTAKRTKISTISIRPRRSQNAKLNSPTSMTMKKRFKFLRPGFRSLMLMTFRSILYGYEWLQRIGGGEPNASALIWYQTERQLGLCKSEMGSEYVGGFETETSSISGLWWIGGDGEIEWWWEFGENGERRDC